ncbi:MAG: ABC-ATPase domain-containing protein [Chloroflexi bacterium]|nr:ABC-ATPase domain-containing protein [Chloroflexota bacterium]
MPDTDPDDRDRERPPRPRFPAGPELRGQRRPPRPVLPGGGTADDLRRRLFAIDGKPYGAYQDILGEYTFPSFRLVVDAVPPDPFAGPARLRLVVDRAATRLPLDGASSGTAAGVGVVASLRRFATEDFLARRFASAIRSAGRARHEIGPSGYVAIDAGRQEVIERSACLVTAAAVEIRFVVGLPAEGRTIRGREAARLLVDDLPRILAASVLPVDPHLDALRHHVATVEDYQALRDQLTARGLIAFITDGASLPRESGVSDLPLRGPNVVPFQSPPELRVTLSTPHSGPITGLGIPMGVTLIVGGGFHGKSTVLAALARGVYPHIPGDGRERVVTRADAVKVRAEDGRSVEEVDLTPFIGELPQKHGTRAFSTTNASGSTSQAASIIEALEAGTSLMLLDEDTTATNFMIRDARMQRLVPKELEPITPFIDQVRNLVTRGVSTIVVVGGSGDYFDVADHVIAMHEYRPEVVTGRAHQIARELPGQRVRESPPRFGPVVARAVLPESLDPQRRGRARIVARGVRSLEFGEATIELDALEQLVDPSQTRAIGDLILHALRKGYFRPHIPLVDAMSRALGDLDRDGFDAITPPGRHSGDYARPRLHELVAALNRLRGIRMTQLR